jgi:ABC-type uncharacterized transport system ATPase subunit
MRRRHRFLFLFAAGATLRARARQVLLLDAMKVHCYYRVRVGLTRAQVLLLDELTTFLDGADQRGVLEAVRACVGGPGQVVAWPVA